MRAVVQRVSRARVTVDGEVTGAIEAGLLVLVGAARGDTQVQADWIARKLAGLRIFDDEQGVMNLDIMQAGGAVLAVSQFTLLGDCRKGRRPSWNGAMPPDEARPLFDAFVEAVRATGLRCETGRFQATMAVELVNDGPVTLILET